MSKKALLVIDLQNDYFPEGKYPLWNTQQTLANIKQAIARANEQQIPVINIQHIANPEQGLAPFFNADTHGVEIHNEISAITANAEVVVKTFADSFEGTNLEPVLSEHDVDELLLCGMMTQNCVTHTALSKAAEKYQISVLADCCTTVDEMIHNIALHALSTRVALTTTMQAF
ncbi:cysteine hydrolase family protein [Vibrio sp. WXL210]|uniref:cysteine hydrolase family protein n=1 Tax=Vibrio sp. WXL210 TaxID=3450709 RepID=UPI003EC5CC64